jgi:hypothetical protein
VRSPARLRTSADVLRSPPKSRRPGVTVRTAYAERFVRTFLSDRTDRIFILSERHLEWVLKAYADHCNRERQHRGLIFEYQPPTLG